MASPVEKRKYPRVDTSRETYCRIKVFGVNTHPLEGQVINLSLGGVAFISHWKNIARAASKFVVRVQIQLPNGVNIDANTTLRRVKPQPVDEQCICVYELTEINNANASRLEHFVPRQST